MIKWNLSSHENNNITLIHEREKTIDEMQEKINEIEHLDGMEKMFHQLESKLENLIERKLDEKMVTINKVKESIVQEVKSNNDCFEQKLDNVIQNNKSFAQASASSGSPLVPDFRSIMNEAKNQELNEENDKKARASNIIIHGLPESVSADKDDVKKLNEEYVGELLRTLNLTMSHKSVYRLGKPDTSKKRPIKLVMNNEVDKQNVMNNLKNLKDVELFRGVSVTEDYTASERNMIRNMVEDAKAKNSKEEPDSRYKWKVRGTPKNGLCLKRLPKQRNAQQPK